jgi:hypothetical protein
MNWNYPFYEAFIFYIYLALFFFAYYIGKTPNFDFKGLNNPASKINKLVKIYRYVSCIIATWSICWILQLVLGGPEIKYERVLKYFFVFTPPALYGVYKAMIKEKKDYNDSKEFWEERDAYDEKQKKENLMRFNEVKRNEEEQENIGCEWIKENLNSVSIEWNKRPFFHKKSIIWRGITIHTKIRDQDEDLGFNTAVVFIINGVKHRFGLGKWKYMGGSIGTKPEIKCETHALKIGGNLFNKTLSLEEEQLNESDPSSQTLENPFRIFDTLIKLTAIR